jgi:DNA-binding response OmpR family regulator
VKNRVLVIDDDAKLNNLLKDYLSKFNFDVSSETYPKNGLQRLYQETFDLIILDIMLPDMDGFEVCKEIRKKYSTPVIMLTARGEVTDRIVGLELGADDYLAKPFEPRELVARMQSILRRGEITIIEKPLRFGDLEINLNTHSVFIEGQEIDLTTAEFELLKLLSQKAGKVLSRDFLLDHLRGLEWESFDRSVDVLISRLRQKLNDDPRKPKYIKTIRSAGYLFIAERNDES